MAAAKRIPLAIIQIMPPTVLKIESCFEQINCTCITDVYIILIFKLFMGEIRDVLLNLVILDKILPKWYHIVWLHVHVTPRTVLVLTFENYFDDL